MKKKLILLFTLLFALIVSPNILLAQGSLIPENRTIPEERLLPRLVDDANLLSGSEVEELTIKLDEISERQNLDVIIITVNKLDEGHNPTTFADDVYDYNGFGIGENRDGILLLLSMAERDWAITTTGYGISVFTDAGQKYMVDKFIGYLSNGDYYKGFNTFADLSDNFITKARENKPYDSGNLPKEPLSPLWIIYSLIGGAVAAFIITLIMKSSLKSVIKEKEASNYFISDSLKFSESQDLFLYDVVTMQRIPEKTSSSSSTHTSSSGTSHGGSRGKF